MAKRPNIDPDRLRKLNFIQLKVLARKLGINSPEHYTIDALRKRIQERG